MDSAKQFFQIKVTQHKSKYINIGKKTQEHIYINIGKKKKKTRNKL